MSNAIHEVKDWPAANAKLDELAGELPLYLGTGNPIDEPHVQASTLDAWSGEGMGCSVWIYPQGSNGMEGLGKERPHEYHLIKITG